MKFENGCLREHIFLPNLAKIFLKPKLRATFERFFRCRRSSKQLLLKKSERDFCPAPIWYAAILGDLFCLLVAGCFGEDFLAAGDEVGESLALEKAVGKEREVDDLFQKVA